MSAYRDASVDFAAIRGDDISSANERRQYTQNQRQHELDELETSKARLCLKKTSKFLFSHMGLVGLVVIYSVAGGFLFQFLEVHEEKINCLEAQGEQTTQITQLKQTIINYIQNNATPTATNSLYQQDNITVALEKIGSMLYNYRTFVLQTGATYRSYGDNCSIVNMWTYPNSLLFAITIVTTIGYGNITPMTWEGQLCSLCFATIGIPISLLCLANISGALGQLFRFLYAKIICGTCFYIQKRRAKARKAKLEEETGISIGPANPSGWTLDDDNRKTSGKILSNPMTNINEIDDEQGKIERIGIPLTVTMIIIAAYITIGSALFHNFEGWTMMQSGYFCFITLATIGFGDFVPGQEPGEKHVTEKLIFGSIYIFIGMAILAMCFDLMQEELIAKFRWIGTKIGIIDKQNQNNDQTNQNNDQINQNNDQINQIFDTKNKNDLNIPMDTNRTLVDNETPTPRNLSATRKLSSRSNTSRVHPMETDPSNEATLHQRVASSKLN